MISCAYCAEKIINMMGSDGKGKYHFGHLYLNLEIKCQENGAFYLKF